MSVSVSVSVSRWGRGEVRSAGPHIESVDAAAVVVLSRAHRLHFHSLFHLRHVGSHKVAKRRE